MVLVKWLTILSQLSGFPLCKSITEPEALCLCVGFLSSSQKRLEIATRWGIFYWWTFWIQSQTYSVLFIFNKNGFGLRDYLEWPVPLSSWICARTLDSIYFPSIVDSTTVPTSDERIIPPSVTLPHFFFIDILGLQHKSERSKHIMFFNCFHKDCILGHWVLSFVSGCLNCQMLRDGQMPPKASYSRYLYFQPQGSVR